MTCPPNIIAALISGGLYLLAKGGFDPWVFLAAVLGFCTPVVGKTIVSAWRAPTEIDKAIRARDKRNAQALNALRETWLKLEVDTQERLSNTGQWTKSNAVLIVDERVPAMSDGPIAEFLLWVNLRIRFHNPDTEDNRIRKIEVSLWKIVGEGEIFVDRSQMTAQPDRGGGGSSLDHYLVKASSTSEDYWLLNFFNLGRKDRDDKTLFVKVTMEAFRQPAATIRVRWDADMAREKSVPVTVESPFFVIDGSNEEIA
jgi:hypothetical protein